MRLTLETEGLEVAQLMEKVAADDMSLSIVDLEVLSKAGTPQDRINAGTLQLPFPLSPLFLAHLGVLASSLSC